MSCTKRPVVCIFLSSFIPGYKYGGPLQTILNLIDRLSCSFEFKVITSDRDLGDKQPYKDVELNVWIEKEKYSVIYLSKNFYCGYKLYSFLKSGDYDLIYFNGFFHPFFTFFPLLLVNFLRLDIPVLIAPRGEFSSAALNIKKVKKNIFLSLFSRLYRDAFVQASSEYEKKDIISSSVFIAKNIYIARNIPKKISTPEFYVNDHLSIVFLSRICEMKNLTFALDVLKEVKVKVSFDIYGPQEDRSYWNKCIEAIENLPNNILVNYCGIVKPTEVVSTLSKYDLLFLPTQGENYGHVIAESLSAGLPVLISDQTPWRNLISQDLGWDFPLDCFASFVKVIEAYSKTSKDHKVLNKKKVFDQAFKLLNNIDVIEDNVSMFNKVIESYRR